MHLTTLTLNRIDQSYNHYIPILNLNLAFKQRASVELRNIIKYDKVEEVKYYYNHQSTPLIEIIMHYRPQTSKPKLEKFL